MAIATRLWTVDEVQALPEDGMRHEVIDGELFVSPGPMPAHQRAAAGLFRQLEDYLDAHDAGYAYFAPADVTYGKHTLVQPDLFVVPRDTGRAARTWAEVGPLLLAVEILSPSTARVDRTIKRRLYQRQSVPEYWIVDLDSRLVERWLPADERPEVLAERLTWRPASAAPPLVIDLPPFFAHVLADAPL